MDEKQKQRERSPLVIGPVSHRLPLLRQLMVEEWLRPRTCCASRQCACSVDLLLRGCPKVKILATSREPIGIPGEISWLVPPLAAPDAAVNTSFADIQRSPAVRLFADRASAAAPEFNIAEENAPAVAQICRRLDGIPLALELGAACLDALTPRQLAAQLDRQFHLFTSGNRAAPPRQQTLTATIAWSYQATLLGPTLGQLLDWTAAIYGATGEPERAARLFGAADSVWLASGTIRYPFDDSAYERDLRGVQAQLEPAAFAVAVAEGHSMSAADAIAHALRET